MPSRSLIIFHVVGVTVDRVRGATRLGSGCSREGPGTETENLGSEGYPVEKRVAPILEYQNESLNALLRLALVFLEGVASGAAMA